MLRRTDKSMKILWNHHPDTPSSHLKVLFDSVGGRGHIVSLVTAFRPPAELKNYYIPAIPSGLYRCRYEIAVRKIIANNKEEYLRLAEEAKYLCLSLRPKHYVFRLIDWQLGLFQKFEPDVLLSWGGINAGPFYATLTLIARHKRIKTLTIENSFLYEGVAVVEGFNLYDPKHYAFSLERDTKANGELTRYIQSTKSRIRHQHLKKFNKRTEEFKDRNKLLGKRLIVVYGPPYYWLHEKNKNYLNNIIGPYKTYRDFLVDLLSIPGFSVLFKPHPGGKWNEKFYNYFFNLPDTEGFHVTNVNPLVLLSYGDKFIAHYSKLETNIVVNNKVLVLPGGGFYAHSGCALTPRNSKELHACIVNDKNSLTQKEQINRDSFIAQNLAHNILSLDDVGSIPGSSTDFLLNKIGAR